MKSIPPQAQIQTKLLRWFKQNGRDLPWRKTKDPYAIWVSEIMLQQTQVATVLLYYEKFLKTFPTIQALAQANLSKVLKVWEGLGYYSRARHLHKASQIVENDWNGKIPNNLKDLLNLPGIGRSTAGAILSIAYNKEAPILDGNVKRVLSRLFAVSEDLKKSETIRSLWQLSESLLPKGKASLFNQALMDLGAMVCIPKDPQCLNCPLCEFCKAYASGKPERFPLKTVKKKIPHFQAVSAVIVRNGRVFLRQRPLKGLLGGLWEFPNWNFDGGKDLKEYLRLKVKSDLGLEVKCREFFGTFEQTYSHFKVTLAAFHCDEVETDRKGRWFSINQLRLLPMSRIDRKIAESLLMVSK